jgi:hypothetical protein
MDKKKSSNDYQYAVKQFEVLLKKFPCPDHTNPSLVPEVFSWMKKIWHRLLSQKKNDKTSGLYNYYKECLKRALLWMDYKLRSNPHSGLYHYYKNLVVQALTWTDDGLKNSQYVLEGMMGKHNDNQIYYQQLLKDPHIQEQIKNYDAALATRWLARISHARGEEYDETSPQHIVIQDFWKFWQVLSSYPYRDNWTARKEASKSNTPFETLLMNLFDNLKTQIFASLEIRKEQYFVFYSDYKDKTRIYNGKSRSSDSYRKDYFLDFLAFFQTRKAMLSTFWEEISREVDSIEILLRCAKVKCIEEYEFLESYMFLPHVTHPDDGDDPYGYSVRLHILHDVDAIKNTYDLISLKSFCEEQWFEHYQWRNKFLGAYKKISQQPALEDISLMLRNYLQQTINRELQTIEIYRKFARSYNFKHIETLDHYQQFLIQQKTI